MKPNAIFLPVLLFAMAAYPCHTPAQTCRVNIGVGSDGSVTYKEVYEFDFVEEKPEFPGGGSHLVDFINRNRRYPPEAYAEGVQGRVMCSFVINTDGSVTNISVIKGVEPTLNTEAVRVLSQMPDWSPGKINGTQVPVRVVCTVPFRK